jgi:hypothetical protein
MKPIVFVSQETYRKLATTAAYGLFDETHSVDDTCKSQLQIIMEFVQVKIIEAAPPVIKQLDAVTQPNLQTGRVTFDK